MAVPGAGIWQSIGIESWSGVRIAQVRPLTSLEANGMGELNLYVRIVREDKGRVIDMSSPPHDAETTVHVAVALTGNDNESALNGEIICLPGTTKGTCNCKCLRPVNGGPLAMVPPNYMISISASQRPGPTRTTRTDRMTAPRTCGIAASDSAPSP